MGQVKTIAFTKGQSDYIKTQSLARIATASLIGEPDVAAVGFEFDGECFYIGEHPGMTSRKYRNIQENPKASLVIDDVVTNGPRKFRMLKVRAERPSSWNEPVTWERANTSKSNRANSAASDSIDTRLDSAIGLTTVQPKSFLTWPLAPLQPL